MNVFIMGITIYEAINVNIYDWNNFLMLNY